MGDGSREEMEARKLLADADKKAAGKGGFLAGVFGGGSSRVDDAIELYCKAANFFKMAKNWSEAGNAFDKAAKLSLTADNKLEAFTKFSDASNCYKKVDANRSLECLKQAVAIQTEMGRFSMAAKTHIRYALGSEICLFLKRVVLCEQIINQSVLVWLAD